MICYVVLCHMWGNEEDAWIERVSSTKEYAMDVVEKETETFKKTFGDCCIKDEETGLPDAPGYVQFRRMIKQEGQRQNIEIIRQVVL